MGWEKCIVLESKEYESVIDSLHKSFQKFNSQYTLVKDKMGFSLCGNNNEWPEIMQISVDIAHQMNYAVLDGEKYIYCLFHIGGDEANLLQLTIISTLDALGVNYVIDDL